MEGTLADVEVAPDWLRGQGCEHLSLVGFCFGMHSALLLATLTLVRSSIDLYGACVCQSRPGRGVPGLELLAQVRSRLTCICGTADP